MFNQQNTPHQALYHEIIEHEGVNASVKVQAIQTFYNACTRFVELTEILQRIEVLENAKVITD